MKVLLKSIISLFITVVILGLLEFGAYWKYKDDIYQGDTAYFWKLKPNLDILVPNQNHPFQLKTNSDGYRNAELGNTLEKWLFLGCSTTMGWGVQQSEVYTSIIQEELTNIEVVNGGQPGWSTHQIVMNLEEFQSWQPTRVFIAAGVRDSQRSFKLDSSSKPRNWLESRYLVRWLLENRAEVDSESPESFRVTPTEFKSNLQKIQEAFPSVPVEVILFPKIDTPTEHIEVLKDQIVYTTTMPSTNFFKDDSIHLNPLGHKEFARWFILQFQPSPD